jgi:hypothetical protein
MIVNKQINKAIVYAFLCIYTFALLKPVMPIAKDIIAHTFFKMEHIAAIHFENGKYHVHQELAANETEQKNNSKGTAHYSVYETLDGHLFSEKDIFNIKSSPLSIKINLPPVKRPNGAFTQNAVPPPEA